MGTWSCQCQQKPGALSTRATPPAKDMRSNCMNEPVRHNQQPRATRNLQTQKASKVPPRKTPRSQLLPLALPFAVSHTAAPEILPGPARASSPAGHKRSRGQAHLFPPSTHPRATHSTAEPSERSGLGRPSESLFKKPSGSLPARAGGGRHVLLPVSQQLHSAAP